MSGRAAFAELRSSGVVRRAGPVSVVYASTPEPVARVGYAIGRSVGSAVERNRVRRRLRHAIAAAVKSGVVVAPGLYLVRPGRGIAEYSSAQLVPFVTKVLGNSR